MAQASNKTVDCAATLHGSATAFRPGAAVAARPVWDKDRCIRCGICYLFCPHGAIVREADGFFGVDEKACSGCGVCHRECWFGVIGMVQEEK